MDGVTDVIIVGLGAMGSAAAQHLAARGYRIVGFDRFTTPHSYGSSHGRTRIFRQSYWEDPRYVPLLFRAQELWRRLEQDSGAGLLHITGGLVIGSESGNLVARSAESARQFRLPHEMLCAVELKARFPALRADPDTIALLEQNAGYLLPERCIEQQLMQAHRAGAELLFDEPVLSWSTADGEVAVQTSTKTYHAEHLVLTVGPWAPEVLGATDFPMRVTRQVLYWFEPQGSIDLFREGSLPVYLFETKAAERLVYGFPLTGHPSEGVKVAVHGSEEICTPESVCREIRPEDELYIRRRLAESLPLLAGRLVRAETCLYTVTPDENFILGPHPRHPQVVLASGFSGHGFKFAPVIGEVIADLVTTGRSQYAIEMFSPARFMQKASDMTDASSL